ncbi:MAG TPA: SAM-dependent methyltransferase [Burkholderiaceae bacterium]|nr:SAM-dependent methyltransferase [Burkholderiaceae bacterium]
MPTSAPSPAAQPPLPRPDAWEQARSDELKERICARIARSGDWLAFADYMQMALYEPALGYYAASSEKFGARGDFVTAPEMSPLFAQAIAQQLVEVFGPLRGQILEFGAGTGALARDLIAELRRRGCAPKTYYILEVSADLRERQRRLLAQLPVTWLESLPEKFDGVVIANEVLDVLPVQLFVRGQDGLYERGVRCDGTELRFAVRRADPQLEQEVAAIEALVGPLPPGYGSELCPLARKWIVALAQCLQRALVLLLDYGFPRREYYHPQRAMGTLMCHYRQRVHADPLWLPGVNDITAHVDFSALAQAAHAAGLQVLGYTSQARFLLNCGILERLNAASDAAQLGAAQRLLSEAEMGELVKVLALGRGFDGQLLGFSCGDRRHRL